MKNDVENCLVVICGRKGESLELLCIRRDVISALQLNMIILSQFTTNIFCAFFQVLLGGRGPLPRDARQKAGERIPGQNGQ